MRLVFLFSLVVVVLDLVGRVVILLVLVIRFFVLIAFVVAFKVGLIFKAIGGLQYYMHKLPLPLHLSFLVLYNYSIESKLSHLSFCWLSLSLNSLILYWGKALNEANQTYSDALPLLYFFSAFGAKAKLISQSISRSRPFFAV